LCLEPVNKVSTERGLVVLFDLLKGRLYGFLGIHEKEGLYSEVDDMAVAPDPLLLRVPNDAFSVQIFAEQAAEFVVRTMIVTGVETNLVPNIVILEDVMKKLPLLGSTMAARAIKSWQL
jgi:hypothetical protein